MPPTGVADRTQARTARNPLSETKMTNNKHARNHVTGSPEQYHGDLRKGAYLKRRAAYQKEAGSGQTARAGTLARKYEGMP